MRKTCPISQVGGQRFEPGTQLASGSRTLTTFNYGSKPKARPYLTATRHLHVSLVEEGAVNNLSYKVVKLQVGACQVGEGGEGIRERAYYILSCYLKL